MRIIISVLLVVIAGCKSNDKIAGKASYDRNQSVSGFAANPRVLVYKTSADYHNLVPVILSDDKKEILSYPDPQDIRVRGGYPVPLSLKDGYLLDNRGIGVNVAFLEMTYREYSRLERVPSLDELFSLILDKDPLTELYDCGARSTFSDPEKQLNLLIKNNELQKTCKRVNLRTE